MKIDLNTKGGGARKELVEVRAFPVMTSLNTPAPYVVQGFIGSTYQGRLPAIPLAYSAFQWNEKASAVGGGTGNFSPAGLGFAIDLGEPKVITRARIVAYGQYYSYEGAYVDLYAGPTILSVLQSGATLISSGYSRSPGNAAPAVRDVEINAPAYRVWGIRLDGTYQYLNLKSFQLFTMGIPEE